MSILKPHERESVALTTDNWIEAIPPLTSISSRKSGRCGSAANSQYQAEGGWTAYIRVQRKDFLPKGNIVISRGTMKTSGNN